MNLIRQREDKVEVLGDFGWIELPEELLQEQELEPLGREVQEHLGGSIINVQWEYFLLPDPMKEAP